MYSMLDSVELHQDPAVLYNLLLSVVPEDAVSCEFLILLLSTPKGEAQANKRQEICCSIDYISYTTIILQETA